MSEDEDEIDALAAIDAIIDNFSRHQREAYFSGFAADATFLFPTALHRLDSRAAYESLWDDWERDVGFRVLGCSSSNRRIQIFSGTAVFSHDVETTLREGDTERTVLERESIIMERREGTWLCVHEHLSARPLEGAS
jgi:ketosteroid isomerase-like protein